MRIFKRTDTSSVNWGYDIRHNGKRYRRTGFKTRNEAKLNAEQHIVDLSKGLKNKEEIIAYDYLKSWIELNKENHLTERSLRRYKLALRIFEQHFGKTKLKDVTRYEFQLMLNEYAEGKTNETVKKLKNCLSGAFKDAVYERLIEIDPTYNLTNIGNKPPMKDVDKYTSITMYKKLIEYFKTKNTESSIVLFIMALTGARFGEVRNLTRKDIQLDYIHLPGTKTESAERDVKLPVKDIQLIKEKISRLPLNINGKIFKITNASANKALKKALDKLNAKDVEYITTHGLRHTHTSYLLSEGIPIEYISKRLGHKSITITLEVYSHLLEESKEKHDEKLLKIL